MTPPEDLRAALLEGAPLLDVRAPIEFAQGALPGAVNIPVLDDEQRAAVGLAYKRDGSDAAIALGRRLVSGADLDAKLEAWTRFASAHPNARVHCFRGGLRSLSVGQALRDAGCELAVLDGGYKRARRFFMEALEHAADGADFVTIGGLTGAGKTDLLHAPELRPRAVDLEALARHRGSTFGAWALPQPAQATFENALALDLWRRFESQNGAPLLLEDESRRIGRLEVPGALFAKLSAAPLYVVERPLKERARYLVKSYLDGLAADSDPQADALHAALRRSLLAIERSLGGAETKDLLAMVDDAVNEQRRTGSWEAHAPWAERILVRYYDRFYLRHLEAASARVVARGTADEIRSALLRQTN